MNKTEILEAINATIAPNNVKGITAESLANILAEIVNATPEGGSGGAGGEYIDMTFANPDFPESMELTPEAMAHNAELYAKMLNAISNRTVAAPSVFMSVDALGVFASSVAVDSETMFFFFHIPMSTGANYMVSGINMTTQETDVIYVGDDLMQIVVALHPDGSAESSIFGLM